MAAAPRTPDRRPNAAALTEAALAGDRLSLARILTAVEKRTPVAEAALRHLYPIAGKAHLVEGCIGQPAACAPSFDIGRYGEDDVDADR